ncbi:hypothetical protein ECTX1999_2473 [Escherichia coli TX1999]|nr:hypothetical protein ECTX1999_2473 [Escherichia coli TX1999]
MLLLIFELYLDVMCVINNVFFFFLKRVHYLPIRQQLHHQ